MITWLPIAINAIGSQVIIRDLDGVASVWDWLSGIRIGPPRMAVSTKFSPDGHKIMTLDGMGTVRLWVNGPSVQLEGAQLVRKALLGAGLSADGKRIATISYDQVVRMWDAASGEPVGPPLSCKRPCFISPDGEVVL